MWSGWLALAGLVILGVVGLAMLSWVLWGWFR
jgi:hypothetical protein